MTKWQPLPSLRLSPLLCIPNARQFDLTEGGDVVPFMGNTGIDWRKYMGIEPTHQLVAGALVLKTRRPTRRLGTST